MDGVHSLAASGAALLLASMLLLSSPSPSAAEDFYGYVRFYDYAKFSKSGPEYWYYTSDSNYCINLSCFDNKATSVEWDNLPSAGADDDGTAKIAFFTGKNCTGDKREWTVEDEDYPYDFSIDGIDNDISSFIIYETGRTSKGNVLPCPWGADLF